MPNICHMFLFLFGSFELSTDFFQPPTLYVKDCHGASIKPTKTAPKKTGNRSTFEHLYDNLLRKWKNKAAGYHRHIFCRPFLLKMPFKRMKAFFSKNTLSLSNFVIFPNSKICWFFEKNSQLRWKRHFQEKISFDTHSTAKWPLLPIF